MRRADLSFAIDRERTRAQLIGEHVASVRRGCLGQGIDHNLLTTDQLDKLRTWRDARGSGRGRGLGPCGRGMGWGRGKLLGIVAALLLTGCGGSGEPPQRVLLVTFDTTRADRIGAYGYVEAETPHLDRFASESVQESAEPVDPGSEPDVAEEE